MSLVVTAAVIEHNGRILITRRPDHVRLGGLWEFPGGKLDDQESPQDGLAREIREELGIAVTVGELCTVVHHRYDWGAILLLAYYCAPLQLDIRNLAVAEHRWITPAELHNHAFPAADLPVIAALLRAGRPWACSVDNCPPTI